MRIAIFSDTFPPQTNGVANTAYQSAQSLSEAGHEVIAVTAAARANQKILTDNNKFKILFCPSTSTKIYPGERLALPLSLSVVRTIKKFRPEIIHSHTPFSLGWGAILAAKISGAKLVGTHHTFYNHYLKHIKLDFAWTERFSWKYTLKNYNCCDLFISPSKALADDLVQHGLRPPIKILANTINTDFFKPVPREVKKELKSKFRVGEQTLVYMGRLSYEKSIDQVLRAFSLVVKINPKIDLLIVGDGPERGKLEELANHLGIEEKTKFTGSLRGKDLVESLEAADVFITASKTENMPLSVLEAMATGLPIIAVPEKGLPEIVKDKVNGLMATADDVQSLAEKILALFADKQLLLTMGSASKTLALEHSPARILARLEKIYRELLNNKEI